MKAISKFHGQVEIISQSENSVIVRKSDNNEISLMKVFANLKDENGNAIDYNSLNVKDTAKSIQFPSKSGCEKKSNPNSLREMKGNYEEQNDIRYNHITKRHEKY